MKLNYTKEGFPVTSGQSDGFFMMPTSMYKMIQESLTESAKTIKNLKESNKTLAQSVTDAEEDAHFYKRLYEEERERQNELYAKVGYVLGRSDIVREAWYKAGFADGWLLSPDKKKTDELLEKHGFKASEESKETAESIQKAFDEAVSDISDLIAEEPIEYKIHLEPDDLKLFDSMLLPPS